MVRSFIAVLLLGVLYSACADKPVVADCSPLPPKGLNTLIANLENSMDDDVIVVAHRGDWRNAPENSLPAIWNCIEMGVEMVEIDVRETKDGQLVLMHDVTIDRTTNGSGLVKDWTLDSLKTLRLLDGLGIPTRHQIPTLEEALDLAKGNILVNLDKSYSIFDKCFAIIEATGTTNQVIIKGKKSRKEVEAEFGDYLDHVYFMPILSLDDPGAEAIVEDYMTHRQPIAFEFLVAADTFELAPFFNDLRERGTSVWINSLWPNLCAGYDDERAAESPEIYDWYIEQEVDMIQTDRPALLIEQLAKNGN
ncbi:MAG: glycerophosphodiester phosphodiesterase family protein [Bacteroidota bacterium]